MAYGVDHGVEAFRALNRPGGRRNPSSHHLAGHPAPAEPQCHAHRRPTPGGQALPQVGAHRLREEYLNPASGGPLRQSLAAITFVSFSTSTSPGLRLSEDRKIPVLRAPVSRCSTARRRRRAFPGGLRDQLFGEVVIETRQLTHVVSPLAARPTLCSPACSASPRRPATWAEPSPTAAG